MWKTTAFVFCLLVVTVCSDHHEDHSHDNDGHSHDDHSHGDHNQADHGHGDHGHGDHGHGQGDHSHGGHDHGHHDHHHEDNQNLARDCAVHLNAGHQESGVQRIKPEGCHHSIEVLCDMETDGGGWTVIQRRGDYGQAADYFYKPWSDYKNGFGELDKEFWIGNYHINHLTEQGNYELKIVMKTLADVELNVNYGTFRVDNETLNYAIHVGDFSGDASADSLLDSNGNGFSTLDRDNDHNDESCAVLAKGAWWYNNCGKSNLNGPHMDDQAGDFTQSIYWFTSDNPILLKSVKMMVRPKH